MDEKKTLTEEEVSDVTGGVFPPCDHSTTAYVPPSWRKDSAEGGLAAPLPGEEIKA